MTLTMNRLVPIFQISLDDQISNNNSNICTIFLLSTKVRHISKFTIAVPENKELQYYPRFVVASWQNLSNFTNSFRSAESAEIAFLLHFLVLLRLCLFSLSFSSPKGTLSYAMKLSRDF